MKELFTQPSSGQLVPYTTIATLQETAHYMLHHLAKSHPLTWVSHQKSTLEGDKLPLWMTIMEDDVDILVTQFQQQLYAGLGKMMGEMAALYHKNDNEVSKR